MIRHVSCVRPVVCARRLGTCDELSEPEPWVCQHMRRESRVVYFVSAIPRSSHLISSHDSQIHLFNNKGKSVRENMEHE